jgi:hypothetical protein
MKYHVIDIDPEMHYDAPGDEVIAVVEAESSDEAIAKAMKIVGVDVMKNFDPAGYAKHITGFVDAIPVN